MGDAKLNRRCSLEMHDDDECLSMAAGMVRVMLLPGSGNSSREQTIMEEQRRNFIRNRHYKPFPETTGQLTGQISFTEVMRGRVDNFTLECN